MILLAPNGKPSNLTPEQYKLVRTKAFKDWFGDWENDPVNASKVVDSNGEPLIVYHGVFSGDKFNIFQKTKDIGFHFSVEKKIAQGMATNESAYKRAVELGEELYYKELIYQCFLNIKKLAYIEDLELWETYKFIKYAEEFADTYGFTFNYDRSLSKIENIRNLYSKISNNDDSKFYPSDFNGLLYFNEYEGKYTNWNKKCFIVFEPNQIKLADGTNTTFDGNNPDIRFDGGGITITDEFSTESYDFGNVGNSIKKNNLEVGQIQYDINKEKGIVSIYLLEVLEKGIGAKVINYFFNNGINIIYGDATDSIEFWEKMGAKFDEFDEDINGYPFTISKEDFVQTKYYEDTNSDIRYAGGGDVQPKDLTTIDNFENIYKGAEYYSCSDNLEKQEKADKWYELFIKNQKEQIITPEEYKEFIYLSNELALEDLD